MQVNIKYTYPFIPSAAELFWLLEIINILLTWISWCGCTCNDNMCWYLVDLEQIAMTYHTFHCQEHSNMCMHYHNWASSDAGSERNDQHLKHRGKLAAYCLVYLILLLKCIQLTHIWPNDGKDLKQVVNSLYLENSCELAILPHTPWKMLLNEPQIRPVGATIPESQHGLSRWGDKIGHPTWDLLLYIILISKMHRWENILFLVTQ